MLDEIKKKSRVLDEDWVIKSFLVVYGFRFRDSKDGKKMYDSK